MKILLVIGLILLALYVIGSMPANQPVVDAAQPVAVVGKQLEVVSFTCGPNSAYYSADITVRNLTASPVMFPKVFVEFTPKSGASFTDSVGLQPSTLPGGALATATLISHDADGKRYGCAILRIQDKDGASVS